MLNAQPWYNVIVLVRIHRFKIGQSCLIIESDSVLNWIFVIVVLSYHIMQAFVIRGALLSGAPVHLWACIELFVGPNFDFFVVMVLSFFGFFFVYFPFHFFFNWLSKIKLRSENVSINITITFWKHLDFIIYFWKLIKRLKMFWPINEFLLWYFDKIVMWSSIQLFFCNTWMVL